MQANPKTTYPKVFFKIMLYKYDKLFLEKFFEKFQKVKEALVIKFADANDLTANKNR